MQTRKRIFLLIITVLLLLAVPGAAFAGDGDDPPLADIDISGDTIGGGSSSDCDCGGNGGSGDSTQTASNDDGGSGDSRDDGGGGAGNTGSGNSGASGAEAAGQDYLVDGEPHCSPFSDIGPQAAAGVGGLASNESGTSGLCEWSCGGQSITFVNVDGEWQGGYYVDDGSGGEGFNYTDVGTGTTNDGVPLGISDNEGNFDLGDAAGLSCGDYSTAGSGGSPKARVEAICWQELSFSGAGSGGGSAQFSCGGDYDVSASVSIGCPIITREPYPRAIVSQPVIFTYGALGHKSASGSRGDCDPGIKNYTITVGWQQLAIPPIWNFDDRFATGASPNQLAGWQVAHTYEAASYGLEPNGPSLNGLLELPSYQVQVVTFWQPYVQERWQEWHDYKFNCDIDEFDCLAIEASCASYIKNIDNGECGQWRVHSDRITIDLRWFGYANAYTIRNHALDATIPPNGIPSVESRECKIPVPVIESQSLIHEP